MDLTYWLNLIRPNFAGRKVIVAMQFAAPATGIVREALSLGAIDVMVVATNGRGLGRLPTELGAELIELHAPVTDHTTIGSIRTCQDAVRNLPSWAADAIDAFDPDRVAIAIGDFLTETPSIHGRPFLFFRRPEWIALDEKTTVDAMWDDIGITRAQSLVAPTWVDGSTQAVHSACTQLNEGDGCVVAIDSADGWIGGAEGTRLIRNVDQLDKILPAEWQKAGRFCRVMPFLEGIPCSIHGIVFRDFVAAMRPMEMVVLREEQPDGSQQFFYAGCGSYFDPPPADREEMRHVARKVGAHLQSRVGFRGPFTVDGIMTRDGFRPTELNPRNGAGLISMMRMFPEQPSWVIADMISSGLEADWQPKFFEHALLAGFDERRCGGTWRSFFNVAAEPPKTGRVWIDTDDVTLVGENDQANVTFATNVDRDRTFVRAAWLAEHVPVGPSTGSLAAAFWNWMNSTYGLGIGHLTAAQSVRSAPD